MLNRTYLLQSAWTSQVYTTQKYRSHDHDFYHFIINALVRIIVVRVSSKCLLGHNSKNTDVIGMLWQH